MANRLYHTMLAATVSAQSSQAAGYAASNVIGTPVDAQWRTTAAGGGEFVTIDLGSSKAVAAVAVNGVNWTGATVKADNSTTPTTVRGTLNTYADNQSRRKGSLEFGATVRYIRIELPASNTDGAAYFYTGLLAAFATAIDLPREALFGMALDHNTPQLSVPLPNGRKVTAEMGAPQTIITARFAPRAADDIEALKRYARAGTVWLNLNLTGQEHRQWPVRHHEPASRRSIERYNREPVELRLEEDC